MEFFINEREQFLLDYIGQHYDNFIMWKRQIFDSLSLPITEMLDSMPIDKITEYTKNVKALQVQIAKLKFIYNEYNKIKKKCPEVPEFNMDSLEHLDPEKIYYWHNYFVVHPDGIDSYKIHIGHKDSEGYTKISYNSKAIKKLVKLIVHGSYNGSLTYSKYNLLIKLYGINEGNHRHEFYIDRGEEQIEYVAELINKDTPFA